MRRTECGVAARGLRGWLGPPEGCGKGPHPDKGGPGGVRGLALPPGGELLPAQPASQLPLFAGACSRFLEILEAPAPGQDARAVLWSLFDSRHCSSWPASPLRASVSPCVKWGRGGP